MACHPNPEKLACRIGIQRPADLADRATWPELFEWLKARAEAFKAAQRAAASRVPANAAASRRTPWSELPGHCPGPV